MVELLRAIRRVARDEGLPSIVVEQHPHMVLGVTDDAIVLDRGGIAYRATSESLLADPAPLDTWLGVAHQFRTTVIMSDRPHHAPFPRRPRRQLPAPEIKDAREPVLRKKSIGAEQLRAVEHKAITEIVKFQQDVGLKSSPTASSAAPISISISWEQLGGEDRHPGHGEEARRHRELAPPVIRVIDKVRHAKNIQLPTST